MTMVKRSVLSVIAAIIVLAIGALLFWKRPSAPPSPSGSGGPASTAAPIRFTGQAAIEIPATVAPTDKLVFTKVLMPGKGFVAVKDSSDEIVGASNLLVFPETDDLRTAIAVKSGQTYTAELHGDDGDGIFDPKNDPPFIVDGKTVTTTFKVR